MASPKNWLMGTCAALSCSASFADALSQQLTKHAQQIAGVDLASGNYGLVPPEDGIHYNKHHIGFFNTDLVGPDGFGYPVTIGWQCLAHHQEHIRPEDDIRPDCRLQIVWITFPITELSKATQQVGDSAHDFPFRFERATQRWPDVHMTLDAVSTYSAQQLSELDQAIDAAVRSWNEHHSAEGTIHYRSELDHPSPRRAELHIDFGSAPQDALFAVLDQLAQTIGPNVVQNVVIA